MSLYNKHDNAKIADDVLLNGNLAATSDTHDVIGEVEIIYKSKRQGNTVFTRTIRRNDLLVTGAVYLAEKCTNLRSSYVTTPLDVLHNVHTLSDADMSAIHIPHEIICGIMVGDGGCESTYNTVHRVVRTDLEVQHAIPFRVVPIDHDLTGDDRKPYFMRAVNGDYVYYYAKRFTATPEINVFYEDGSTVNTSSLIAGVDRGKLVKTFIKFTTSVGPKDIREYFKMTEGNTIRSLVNSIGLITGYPMDESKVGYEDEIMEFALIRGMTTLNTENYPLKDDESAMDITYRLYFV